MTEEKALILKDRLTGKGARSHAPVLVQAIHAELIGVAKESQERFGMIARPDQVVAGAEFGDDTAEGWVPVIGELRMDYWDGGERSFLVNPSMVTFMDTAGFGFPYSVHSVGNWALFVARKSQVQDVEKAMVTHSRNWLQDELKRSWLTKDSSYSEKFLRQIISWSGKTHRNRVWFAAVTHCVFGTPLPAGTVGISAQRVIVESGWVAHF